MNWDDAMKLILSLYNDELYRLSLLVACGCFFGCKTYELLELTWDKILNKDFIIFNKRKILIDVFLREHIKKCYASCSPCLPTDKCFISRKKQVFTIQRVNVLLKECKEKYNLDINNFSTVTFMKTYINKVLEDATDKTQVLGILHRYFYSCILKEFFCKVEKLNDTEVLSIKQG